MREGMIGLCEMCELHLDHDSELFWLWKQVVQGWYAGHPVRYQLFLDGTCPPAFFKLEFYEFMISVEDNDKEHIICKPISCPHFKPKKNPEL